MILPFSLLERRSVDSPTNEELAALTGAIAGTASLGVALSVPAAQVAIRAIAEAAACLDIGIVEVAKDGTETPVRSHSVAELLADQPDSWQSNFDLIRDLVPEVQIRSITADSQRDLPCVNIAPSEADTFWAKFTRRLAHRGLSNVKQVICYAHEGVKAPVFEVWRECGCATLSTSCTTI